MEQMSIFDFLGTEPAHAPKSGQNDHGGGVDGVKAKKSLYGAQTRREGHIKKCGEDEIPCAWKDGSHCDTCKRETLPKRIPCGRRCFVECFSKACFIRRGYIWAPEQDPRHNWLRDEKGKIIIGPKQCDWEPVDRICRTCEHFQKSVCGLGDIYHGVSCFGFGISRSQDPNQEACNDWEKATDGEPWRTSDRALNAWLGYEDEEGE